MLDSTSGREQIVVDFDLDERFQIVGQRHVDLAGACVRPLAPLTGRLEVDESKLLVLGVVRHGDLLETGEFFEGCMWV
jgi:hypothetical protein